MQLIRSLHLNKISKGLWFVLLLSLIVAGCGNGNNSATSSSASGESQPTPSASVSASASASTPAEDGNREAGTRLFTDDLGRKVTIPANPQRVIASEFSAEALTVGVTPVGIGPNDLKNAFTGKALEGVLNIGDPPDAEKMLALQPDLILMSTFIPQIYPEAVQQLEKIAPVVYIAFEDPIYHGLLTVADALNKQDKAKEWIAEYETDRDAARKQIREALGDETVTIFRIQKGRLRIYLSTNFGGYALRSALDAPAPDAVSAEIAKSPPWTNAVEISLEKLPEYAGDHILLIVSEADEDQAEYKSIADTPIWKGLPAVQEGNVHLLDTSKYYNYDNITVRETMKEMAKMLSE